MAKLILCFLLMVMALCLGFICSARYLQENVFQEQDWDLVNKIPYAMGIGLLVAGVVATLWGSGSAVAGKDTTDGNAFKSGGGNSQKSIGTGGGAEFGTDAVGPPAAASDGTSGDAG